MKKLFVVAVIFFTLRLIRAEKPQYEWDENGYVLYCPCMGRFGNQASHFLGALVFAKSLNRTLALPPWRSYVSKRNVPYTDWFQLEPVQSFLKVLPMEDFMEQLAPTYWPPEQRIGYCYRPPMVEVDDCQMKNGNPFGPFWDELGVDFVRSKFTGLSHDLRSDYSIKRWQKDFPPDKHPVLAFKGAPARFPVLKGHRDLQRYVQWNTEMTNQADRYIGEVMGGQPYIAVHMRIGIDWERACEHAAGRREFMESLQCLEDYPKASLTAEICLPSRALVTSHIRSLARRSGLSVVFVASDTNPDIPDLQQRLGNKIELYYLNPHLPQLDLVIMGKANFFIGNCVSSFSAFVKRERDANGLPSEFWGVYDLIMSLRKSEL